MNESQSTVSSFIKGELLIPQIKRFKSKGFQPDHQWKQLESQQINHIFEKNYTENNYQLALMSEKSGFTKVQSTDMQIYSADQMPQLGIVKIEQEEKLQCFNQDSNRVHIQIQVLLKHLSQQNNHNQKMQNENRLNTKNILRNICNAQNQYILFNDKSQQRIQKYIKNADKFKEWISNLHFHTFQQFQQVWNGNKGNKIYTKLYKRFCKRFYIQNAIPYIIHSRIKNKNTKFAHIRYLYRFVEGVSIPNQFYYFKQKDKL